VILDKLPDCQTARHYAFGNIIGGGLTNGLNEIGLFRDQLIQSNSRPNCLNEMYQVIRNATILLPSSIDPLRLACRRALFFRRIRADSTIGELSKNIGNMVDGSSEHTHGSLTSCRGIGQQKSQTRFVREDDVQVRVLARTRMAP
jgi:hypothetical protein